MNRVFVAQDPIEANFVKDLLGRAGIAAEVQESLFGLRPLIGFAGDNFPAVWINQDAQLKTALKLVADFEQSKKTIR